MNTPPRQHSQSGLPSTGRQSTSRRQPDADEHLQAIAENLADRAARLSHRVVEIERELARLARCDGSLRPRTAAIIDELTSGAREELAMIDSSMRRIADNEFDCCMTCGRTISLDQLKLFPYSVNCDRCSADFPLGYAEKLRVQHLRMRDSLGALSELIESIMLGCSCGESTGPDRAAALLVLVDLDRDLPEHFALEERDGFLSSAVATAPRFHRRAARLLLQHGDFCERLTRLLSSARQAGEGVQNWTRLQQDFLRLSGDLLEHERFENDLIGRAHTEDIGSAG